jgi:photosystem II stability/assembly factor-like uncharacterized protein
MKISGWITALFRIAKISATGIAFRWRLICRFLPAVWQNRCFSFLPPISIYTLRTIYTSLITRVQMKLFTCLLIPIVSLITGCSSSSNSTSSLWPPAQLNGRWEWQNPLPQGNPLHDITFVDEQQGWAVGDMGTILHTVDGGESWQIQQQGAPLWMFCVFALDRNTVWAAGRSNGCDRYTNQAILYHSTDAGGTWRQTLLPESWMLAPKELYFADANFGWMISGGTFGRTTDGGQTWTRSYSLTENVTAMSCVNREDIWAANFRYSDTDYGIFQHSSDGGENWVVVDSLADCRIEAMHFINTNIGWVIAYNILNNTFSVRRTTDCGYSWQTAELNSTRVDHITFATPSTGWAWCNGALLRSTNSGASWSDLHVSQCYNFAVVGENRVWGATGQGYTTHSTDGGVAWSTQGQSDLRDIEAVAFVDTQHGWCAGWDGLYRTSDGGRNWVQSETNPVGNVHAICFRGQTNGWVLGGYGNLISRTTNGGETWSSSVSIVESPQTVYDFCFSDAQNGWAVGTQGTIRRTRDGGLTWTVVACTTQVGLSKVAFADTLRGCILQDSYSATTIMSTRDGGQTWRTQSYSYLEYPRDMRFSGPSGWIVGDQGMILHSPDGGETWELQSSGTIFRLYSVACASPDIVWAAGECGTVLATTNGGRLWQSMAVPSMLGSPFTIAAWGGEAWVGSSGFQLLHFDPYDYLAVLDRE